MMCTTTDDLPPRPALCQGALLCLLALLCCPYSAFAAQVTLAWDDPDNNPHEIGGYHVYYWQESWDAPAKVAVPPTAIPYTLSGLEAGQTYHCAVTAYDLNGARESAFSNEISFTTAAVSPTARFHATSATTGAPPLTVHFVDTSTGNITSWS